MIKIIFFFGNTGITVLVYLLLYTATGSRDIKICFMWNNFNTSITKNYQPGMIVIAPDPQLIYFDR